MKLLCKLVGHQPSVYARKGRYSPGKQYGQLVLGATDGIGRIHGVVKAKCARCGDIFMIVRVHVPEQALRVGSEK